MWIFLWFLPALAAGLLVGIGFLLYGIAKKARILFLFFYFLICAAVALYCVLFKKQALLDSLYTPFLIGLCIAGCITVLNWIYCIVEWTKKKDIRDEQHKIHKLTLQREREQLEREVTPAPVKTPKPILVEPAAPVLISPPKDAN